MPKKLTSYVCQNCGSETSQYFGRCTICKEWNTIIEEDKNKLIARRSKESINKKSKSFSEIQIEEVKRLKSGFTELDRVLGGGFVNGSVVLLGGEPGIGKSTLVLQSAAKISLLNKVLYITAEESLEQVKIRWERLNQSSSNLKIFAESELSLIIEEIQNNLPAIAIIDSIQAIHNIDMESSCGSVSQVRSCSSELQKLAKESNISLLIIGHVTKDGNLAGPKTLEHLVDVVLNFEGDQISSQRLLRSFKNRFGATLEIGIFDMKGDGLQEVKNPSSSFTNKENISGVATAITNEGTRSFAVDIQALVNKSYYNNPRRTTTGINLSRLHQILAVLEKHIKIKLSEYDCYLATAGGFEINDTSSDLAIAIAILSSLINKSPIHNSSFVGELGLSGQLRPTKNLISKIEESIRLGFENILLPKTEDKLYQKFGNTIKIIQVANINEAMNVSLKNNV